MDALRERNAGAYMNIFNSKFHSIEKRKSLK